MRPPFLLPAHVVGGGHRKHPLAIAGDRIAADHPPAAGGGQYPVSFSLLASKFQDTHFSLDRLGGRRVIDCIIHTRLSKMFEPSTPQLNETGTFFFFFYLLLKVM